MATGLTAAHLRGYEGRAQLLVIRDGDKILRSAKLGDILVQQPTKFELVINVITPRQLDALCQ